MFNKIVMVGNLTRDIEMKNLQSGALAKTAIAVNRRYKRSDGTPAEEVCFVDIDIFGRSAEIAQQFLRKGSKVLIEGRLKQESWTDQSGQKRSKHSIMVESFEMLDARPQNDGYGNQNGYGGGNSYGGGGYGGGGNSYGGGQNGYGGGYGGQQSGYGSQNNYGGANSSGNSYGSQQSGNYANQGGYQAPQNTQIPSIDVNADMGDDEIPF